MCWQILVPRVNNFQQNCLLCDPALTILILLLIQILFDLHDVSGLKDAECCSLAYVDPNGTELGNGDVLPFQLSKLFSPRYVQ